MTFVKSIKSESNRQTHSMSALHSRLLSNQGHPQVGRIPPGVAIKMQDDVILWPYPFGVTVLKGPMTIHAKYLDFFFFSGLTRQRLCTYTGKCRVVHSSCHSFAQRAALRLYCGQYRQLIQKKRGDGRGVVVYCSQPSCSDSTAAEYYTAPSCNQSLHGFHESTAAHVAVMLTEQKGVSRRMPLLQFSEKKHEKKQFYGHDRPFVTCLCILYELFSIFRQSRAVSPPPLHRMPPPKSPGRTAPDVRNYLALCQRVQ